jgi:hypothetical protein
MKQNIKHVIVVDGFEIAKPSMAAPEKARSALDAEIVEHIPNRSALSW